MSTMAFMLVLKLIINIRENDCLMNINVTEYRHNTHFERTRKLRVFVRYHIWRVTVYMTVRLLGQTQVCTLIVSPWFIWMFVLNVWSFDKPTQIRYNNCAMDFFIC